MMDAAYTTTYSAADLKLRLKQAGLRATPARAAVLRLLLQSRSPISHAEVADRIPDATWDRATAYRNLVDLVKAGLAKRSDLGDHVWRFEALDPQQAATDHSPQTHPHFVCTTCGTVECLPEMTLPPAAVVVPRSVALHRVEVQVKGVCDDCSDDGGGLDTDPGV